MVKGFSPSIAVQQGGDILADVMVLGAVPEILGASGIIFQGRRGDGFEFVRLQSGGIGNGHLDPVSRRKRRGGHTAW